MSDLTAMDKQADETDPLAFVRFAVPAALVVLWLYQLQINSWDRFLAWDEAVYFSQVADGHLASDLAVQRSRIVSVVVWPVGVFTDSVAVLRTYLLVVVSATVLWLGTELRKVGAAAQIGLALFVVSATPAFHAAELSANLWVGLLALGIVLLVAMPRGSPTVDLAVLALVAFVIVLMRPPDSAVFLTGIAVVMLVDRTLRDFRRIAALTVGGLTGLALWMFDAASRSGDLSAVFSDGNSQIAVEFGFRLGAYADMLDGPLRGTQLDGVSLAALAPWLVILGAAVVAMLRRKVTAPERSPAETAVIKLALVGGALLSAEYLMVAASKWVRFIYPGWLLISVGVFAAIRAGKRSQVALSIMLLVVVLAQPAVLRPIGVSNLDQRDALEAVGLFLDENRNPAGCAAASQFGSPQVAFASNCLVVPIHDREDTLRWLQDRAAEGMDAHVVVFRDPNDSHLIFGEFERLQIDESRFWSVAEIPVP